MGVFSDRDLTDAINDKELCIEPFVEKNLTPNGYDLSIDEVYIKKTDSRIKKGIAVIPPQTWFAISTKEFIKMGRHFASQLWIRSSYARKGILASFGKVDAGFHGTLTFGCFNASHEDVEIPIGDRFCQIVFEELTSSANISYDKRSGNYQNQRGVTLTADCGGQHKEHEDCMICTVCGKCREDLDSNDICMDCGGVDESKEENR